MTNYGKINKGDIMSYEIKSLNDQGKGVCFVDNKITFVDNTVIGDIVEINIIKTSSKYNLANVTKYIKKSLTRTKSFCPYSEVCGGCSLANISYQKTLEFKQNKINHALKKFGNIDTSVSIIASEPNLNYRNKITLKVLDGVVGYFKEQTNEIVPIKECMVASIPINDFIKYIKDFEIKNGEVIIRSNYNSELLINFITDDPIILVPIIDLKIVGILKNGKILKGDTKFMQNINNHFFQVSYDSFFQINPYICSQLFNLINEHILPNSNVLDLYCGVGTLGLSVTNKINKLYGIEIVPNAVINAVTNAKMNNINNAKYMLGDTSKTISKIDDKIDVIIIDPPRNGLDKKSLKTILAMNPKQIIYVSCDPITLSRDLKELTNLYNIDYISGLDMFPYSYHVETLAVLKRK